MSIDSMGNPHARYVQENYSPSNVMGVQNE